jgi:hypothetical protein
MLGEEGLSVKEAAARLGIPRGTLYEELKRIRQVFAEHGPGAYPDFLKSLLFSCESTRFCRASG